MTTDIYNRQYARLADLKVGDYVEVDGGFTCMTRGEKKKVKKGIANLLYIDCDGGGHYLIEQIDRDGFLIGIFQV
jgi:hypothetical protein